MGDPSGINLQPGIGNLDIECSGCVFSREVDLDDFDFGHCSLVVAELTAEALESLRKIHWLALGVAGSLDMKGSADRERGHGESAQGLARPCRRICDCSAQEVLDLFKFEPGRRGKNLGLPV